MNNGTKQVNGKCLLKYTTKDSLFSRDSLSLLFSLNRFLQLVFLSFRKASIASIIHHMQLIVFIIYTLLIKDRILVIIEIKCISVSLIMYKLTEKDINK